MSISTVFAEELAPKRTLGAVLGLSEVLDKSCTKGPLVGSIFEGILDIYLMGTNTMVGEVYSTVIGALLAAAFIGLIMFMATSGFHKSA